MVLESCKKLDIEKENYRFSRRDVREYTGVGNTQLRVHIARLEELEYLIPHRGSKGQTFVYELLYDGKGKDGNTFLHGLISTEKLIKNYDVNLAGVNENLAVKTQKMAGLKRPQNGGLSGGVRGSANDDKQPLEVEKSSNSLKNAHLEPQLETKSYHTHNSSLAAKEEANSLINEAGV